MTYGCHNKPRAEGYYVKTGQAVVGVESPRVVVQYAEYHADTSSRECRYDQRANDPKCAGCRK